MKKRLQWIVAPRVYDFFIIYFFMFKGPDIMNAPSCVIHPLHPLHPSSAQLTVTKALTLLAEGGWKPCGERRLWKS